VHKPSILRHHQHNGCHNSPDCSTVTNTKQFGSYLRPLHGLGRLGRHVPDRSMVPVRSKCYIASHEFVVAVEAASLLFFFFFKIPGGFVRTLLLYQLLHCLIIRHCYSFWIRTGILTACLPYSSVHTSHYNPCIITISVLALFITRGDFWIFKMFRDVIRKNMSNCHPVLLHYICDWHNFCETRRTDGYGVYGALPDIIASEVTSS
jgi:hypothetical protein